MPARSRKPSKSFPAAATAVARRISPGSARSLLLTLLGEFVLPARQPIFTAPLLHGLAGVGVAEKAARQAIARAASAGWIASERDGRRSAWRMSERGQRLIGAGSKRVRSLGRNVAPWNGEWLVLHITLPAARQADRLRMYRALSWIGCGNPTPGVWITPHVSRVADAERLISELDLGAHTLAFTARSLDLGMTREALVAKAWDLATVARHYRDLVTRFTSIRPRTDDQILFAHIQLVNALQRLPSIDPGLPEALLPGGWNTTREADRLWALREKWHAPAHARWDQLADEVER